MRRILNEVAIKTIIHLCIGLSLSEKDLNDVANNATLKNYAAGEELFHEGDEADGDGDRRVDDESKTKTESQNLDDGNFREGKGGFHWGPFPTRNARAISVRRAALAAARDPATALKVMLLFPRADCD